ncbi:hypothetical protein [Ensifer sp. SSB1]|uniref:hypothetical protein n=1 Tax=Ensifer sp. SSB1 TaxID=2795385 RepID=UPI0025C3D0DD|nr:hypothetical protein [Ensifer sp. SSB1]
MKDMAIYFKDIEVPPGLEPGDDIRKVFGFRQKCIDEKKVFFKPFADVHTFRDAVREKLEEIGWRETEVLSTDNQLDQPKRTAAVSKTAEDVPTGNERLLDEAARVFLQDLIERTPDWDRTAAHEVARLRLIGTAVTRSGNDETYLGNHDANLIFRKYRDEELSEQEVRALIDCGVVGFQHQNAPLWRWLMKDDAGIWFRIRILAMFGAEAEKKQAIDLLSLGSQTIPSLDEVFDLKRVLTSWLSDQAPAQVFDAAVSYLSHNGDEGAIPLIEEVTAESSPARRDKVEGAIVAIVSRTRVDGALKRLVEKEVNSIDSRIAEFLFESPQSLSTNTMISCLSAKPEIVRLRATEILFGRKAIAIDVAHTLLTDSNHEIRLIAAETLERHGEQLDDEVIKKALRVVRPSSRLLTGLGGLQTDDTLYDRYRLNRLSELGLNELVAKVQSAGVFDQRELTALYAKYPSKMKDEIRENLRDRFKRHFDEKVAKEFASIPAADIEQSVRSVESFHRGKLCEAALEALCAVGRKEDVPLVRRIIDEFEVGAHQKVLSFLSRFGDWSDLERVSKLGDSSKRKTSLLDFARTEAPSQKASAIFALGKGRVADMLALDLQGAIRISLAKLLPKNLITELKDELLLREMQDKHDEYRVVFTLRCIQTLSKTRLAQLLERYMNGDGQHFYNVIHWLDLGVSLPSSSAKSIAERALSRH